MCCSVLQCVAACCIENSHNEIAKVPNRDKCVAVCCSVLQCVAAC